MLEPVKKFLRDRLPFLGDLHSAVARGISNIVDRYYAGRPFSPSNIRLTPYGFRLGGGNSLHHKAMQEGRFEPEEIALIRSHFRTADVFVDVGANIGFYTCMARQEGKHVVAVEPQSGNLMYLYANLLANHWDDAEVFPLGLGAAPGILPLFGASSTGASLIPGWAGASPRYRQTIPVTTMDILLGERFRGKKLFIKIDVEGVEHDVLRGANRTLNLDPKPTWMVEICLRDFHPGGGNPNYAATFRTFWENGYEARTADQHLRPVTPEDVDLHVRTGQGIPGAINIIFTPVAG